MKGGTRWDARDILAYQQRTGKSLAPGSMALELPADQTTAWGAEVQAKLGRPSVTQPMRTPQQAELAAVLAQIQGLAQEYEWIDQYFCKVDGPDPGLYAFLVREVLVVLVARPQGEGLSADQEEMLAAYQRVGSEVYIWTGKTQASICARLASEAPAERKQHAHDL